MRVIIAGGTGFIGRALSERLLHAGYDVIVLTRGQAKGTDQRITYIPWLQDKDVPIEKIGPIDAVINLAGESINNRWTKKMKERILQSRLVATSHLYQLIARLPHKPKVYIQASAVGFYGTSETKTFTENETERGQDFLAEVVAQWEKAGKQIEEKNIRTVYIRFGVVLDRHAGALPRIVLPYKLFAGGTIGNGRQWLSWIHVDDVCELILFGLNETSLHGKVNGTAPHPVQMKTFGKTVSHVLKRPHWLPVPSFALKALLGEMSLLVLEGQRVLPEKALQHGFRFQYEQLDTALKAIFSDNVKNTKIN